MSEAMSGRMIVVDGRVVPDEDLKALYRRRQDMLLCLGGDGFTPYFFYEPRTGMYWEYLEFEDGQETLRPVTREWIERNWPGVRCDDRVAVDRPVRY